MNNDLSERLRRMAAMLDFLASSVIDIGHNGGLTGDPCEGLFWVLNMLARDTRQMLKDADIEQHITPGGADLVES